MKTLLFSSFLLLLTLVLMVVVVVLMHAVAVVSAACIVVSSSDVSLFNHSLAGIIALYLSNANYCSFRICLFYELTTAETLSRFPQ